MITPVTTADISADSGTNAARNGFREQPSEKWKSLSTHNPIFPTAKKVEYPVSYPGAIGVLTRTTNGTIHPAKVSLLSGFSDYNWNREAWCFPMWIFHQVHMVFDDQSLDCEYFRISHIFYLSNIPFFLNPMRWRVLLPPAEVNFLAASVWTFPFQFLKSSSLWQLWLSHPGLLANHKAT